MNKTVNINLAGTSFHIDEDAFGKLSRYLDAIRKSLKGADGSEEIMQDIESRIGELFSEKMENPTQVVSLKMLDEVISVMGQPEDYEVDDEIFEDVPLSSKTYTKSRGNASHKQLFRDVDNKYISGVSSGIGHYLGIDAIWIRLLWVLLIVAGFGSPVVIYILLWILVPPALTTSDKLKMTGEPINISNIERKFKEGFDNVADRVKNADYDKYGNQIKTGASGFFDTLGNVIVTLFKVFAKLIGVLIIIVSLSTIIGLVVGFFTFGSMDFWGNNEMMESFAMVDVTNVPMWLLALLCLFAIGIPFFALFTLGLKLLISNLKSMSPTIKIVLIVVWALSIIALAILGIKQGTEQAYDGNFIEEQALPINTGDTLHISMRADKQYSYEVSRNNGLELKYNGDDKKIIYSNDILLNIKSTKDSVGKIIIEKSAEGNNHLDAKKRAEAIEYRYTFENNSLTLDGFFITAISNKYRDQEIEITIYLPEGTVVYPEENTSSYALFNPEFKELSNWDNEAHYFRILKNKAECLDCSEKEEIIEKTDSIIFSDVTDSIITSQPVQKTDKTKSWEEEVKADFNE
ncbi:putative stress-responsive transcriptional regulator [Aequorivita sublithincola DSM 14238]|uniref:Putative stress-responsive transcriptional regulator n=1 Tax=Aequorivita sublithincola (strain DSM 14238 / LMG 21431 / ACAM 643 / 9-3) TaxID=746697 RepID=I3YX99_AEQSU|nr:PspC domain-containing protein [Aequorivita sublithincola]AFL81617.1 putative stress-responsive transcriptional regulator [Aequorivita sublithincola DSM 14238]